MATSLKAAVSRLVVFIMLFKHADVSIVQQVFVGKSWEKVLLTPPPSIFGSSIEILETGLTPPLES
jgi:hypothetical protein